MSHIDRVKLTLEFLQEQTSAANVVDRYGATIFTGNLRIDPSGRVFMGDSDRSFYLSDVVAVNVVPAVQAWSIILAVTAEDMLADHITTALFDALFA